MKSLKDIKNSVRQFNVNPRSEMRSRVLDEALKVHRSRKHARTSDKYTWRTIMKSPRVQFATAAVAVLAIYLCLQIPKSLVAPAYALDDTIQAYRSVRYLYVKAFNTIAGRKLNSESWIEFDEDGKQTRFRVQLDWFTTDKPLGPITFVNDGDRSHTWLPKLNLCFRRSGKSALTGALLQMMRSDVDPKLICEKLHQQARDGEIILEINEPDQKNEPIVLVVTYPAENRSANWKKVLYIDQATRLVTKEEKFEMRGGRYQHERTTEFFDYNQQINPEGFSLDNELPENVFIIDQSGKEVGLAQGDMTDEEITKELISQVVQAFIAGDFNKVGQLYLGVPGLFMEQLLSGTVLKKLISVGPVHRDPDPDSNLIMCSCKLIIEVGGQYYETDMKVYVVPVSGQPGRWMICRMFGSSKPASDIPKPLEMVLIPPGTFMMGSPSDEQDRDPDEGPQHQVTLTQGFYMGKYEVTVGQYVAFLEATGKESGVDWNDNDCPLSRSNGRYTLRDGRSWNQPMVEVSWYGAAMYCNYLSEIEGLQSIYKLDTWEVDWSANGYRLPTEAEWEYACRAGTQTRFYWGNDPRNSQEIPNAFGLYHMSANVYEWCQDWYGSYGDGNQTDPIGPGSGSNRVLRGGHSCRSAHRHKNSPDEQHASIGFRLLRLNP
jgi:formylglycine-generating enzyme required for sulfatase activity